MQAETTTAADDTKDLKFTAKWSKKCQVIRHDIIINIVSCKSETKMTHSFVVVVVVVVYMHQWREHIRRRCDSRCKMFASTNFHWQVPFSIRCQCFPSQLSWFCQLLFFNHLFNVKWRWTSGARETEKRKEKSGKCIEKYFPQFSYIFFLFLSMPFQRCDNVSNLFVGWRQSEREWEKNAQRINECQWVQIFAHFVSLFLSFTHRSSLVSHCQHDNCCRSMTTLINIDFKMITQLNCHWLKSKKRETCACDHVNVSISTRSMKCATLCQFESDRIVMNCRVHNSINRCEVKLHEFSEIFHFLRLDFLLTTRETDKIDIEQRHCCTRIERETMNKAQRIERVHRTNAIIVEWMTLLSTEHAYIIAINNFN